MYLERAALVGLFRDVRQRLRAGGALLVAEPDPDGVVGRIEVAAKRVYAAVKSRWDPTRFIFHGASDAQAMLREAGFVMLRDRPDLRPMYPGGLLPRMPPYFIIAATV
jgi:O-methyltransferase involved in polyketide biosynthesis